MRDRRRGCKLQRSKGVNYDRDENKEGGRKGSEGGDAHTATNESKMKEEPDEE